MFTGVTHEHIDEVWPEVLPWVEQACGRMRGRYESPHIKERLISGAMQLWVYRNAHGVAAICVTHIETYPTGKKYCRIFIGTGRKRREWQQYVFVIEAWAKSIFCNGCESFARIGWWRAFFKSIGWQRTHEIIEKEF
jgi:hypothetical protein